MAPAATNIVVATLEKRSATEVVEALAARGVLAAAMDDRTLRWVTHHDVSRADCQRAADVMTSVLGGA